MRQRGRRPASGPGGIVLLLSLLTSSAAVPAAPEDDYAAVIGKWREQFDDDVRSGGWLALAGRYPLAEGEWSIGSDAGNGMVLPAGAPARLGTLKRHGRWVGFEPVADLNTTLDDAPLTGLAELATRKGAGRVRSGAWGFAVRQVGEDYYVLVQNQDNPAIEAFKGTSWFAIDPAWKVMARFVPYTRPERRAVPMMHIDSKESMSSLGAVSFQLGGRTHTLRTFSSGEHLFVMFRDRTNGRETYGGGRFLEAPLPDNGIVVLDFNKAFNPYCSVNSYVICPVVPAENHLTVAVTAGERFTDER
jgi:uncharacterized protein